MTAQIRQQLDFFTGPFMATFFMTLQPDDFLQGTFVPGIRLHRFRDEPALNGIAPGRRMKLQRPDGTTTTVSIKQISAPDVSRSSYSLADAATLYHFPDDPVVHLEIEPTITELIAPPGTMIFVLD